MAVDELFELVQLHVHVDTATVSQKEQKPNFFMQLAWATVPRPSTVLIGCWTMNPKDPWRTGQYQISGWRPMDLPAHRCYGYFLAKECL